MIITMTREVAHAGAHALAHAAIGVAVEIIHVFRLLTATATTVLTPIDDLLLPCLEARRNMRLVNELRGC
jgi:hypothetical protein